MPHISKKALDALEAQVAAAQEEVRRAKALRFSEPAPGPDLQTDIHKFGGNIGNIEGYLVQSNGSNFYCFCELSWSTGSSHGKGPLTPGNRLSGSQGGRNLYSSRLTALRKLRNLVEHEAAKELARIDKLIEDEQKDAFQ